MPTLSCFNKLLLIIGIFANNLIIHLIDGARNDDLNEFLIKGSKRFNEASIPAITFPGTKWCGPGNQANGYDDLGKFRDTDICCRSHDNCDNIPPYQEKYGLYNDYQFTRLNCKCDKEFYNCLHKINDAASTTVGKTYFQFSNGCFRNDYPKTGCLEMDKSFYDKRCLRYSYDKSKPKAYQWFDLPYYTSDKMPDFDGSADKFIKLI